MSDHWREEGSSVLTGSQIVALRDTIIIAAKNVGTERLLAVVNIRNFFTICEDCPAYKVYKHLICF